ncbi:DUF4028 family protein [Bacillus chungangensis]|uniref:DUF4028 domain-containing protein n=1 Tax=Bacillus chungangensis TaxID=587633 RepID=A0ABT9WMJ0_9BACI|nr:DUF4028 family protein [Bacillus chungangensis]MDQ0174395.1 hypothetical protein [Bacillus chungangensis]
MKVNIADFSNTHKLCIVETRKGYQYACTWSVEKNVKGEVTSPTSEQVKDAWRENRNDFEPYAGRMYL